MKEYTAKIVEEGSGDEVLRITVGEAKADVLLTKDNGTEGLRQVYEMLLAALVDDDATVHLEEKSQGVTAMYQQVCEEWIKVLNRDLSDVRKEMVEKGIAKASEA